MDKRRHRRLATHIEVFFSIAQSGIHSGFLLDYGKGGAFLTFKNNLQNPANSDAQGIVARSIQIHFSLDDKEYLLDGVVAHLSKAGIGVRFTQVDALAFSALAEAARRLTVNQGKDSGIARDRKSQEPKQCAQRCLQLLEASFKEWIPEFLDSFCETLLTLAEQRRAGVDPQALLDAFTWLKSNNTRLLERSVDVYAEAINKLLTADGIEVEAPSVDLAADDNVSLSLVEKDVFEDWLMQKVATSRVELALREPLAELGLRIEAVSGKKFREDRHPFSPALFFRVTHEALRANQISLVVEKLFFKMIVERAIERFARLYDSLNAALVQMGVLPELNVTRHLISKHASKELPAHLKEVDDTDPVATRSPTSHTATPNGVRTPNSGAKSIPGEQHALHESIARDAYATASRLLQMQRQIQHQVFPLADVTLAQQLPVGAPMPGAPKFDVNTETLIKALNQVSNELCASFDAGKGENAALPAQVMDRLKQLNIGCGDDVRDALNMMDSLVANIADEQKMTGDLRAEFCKMQVPLAALQVADPDIFQAENHPVRELLNYLALLSEPSSANFKSNAETVKNVIHRLMAADPLNEQAVNVIVKDLRKQIDREKSIIERNVQRVVESCDGRQRIAQVNDYLLDELNSRLADKKVPRVLLRLLDAGWKELMRLSLVREGPESRAWQISVNVIDDVNCLLGKRPIPEDELHFALDPLIKIIDKGLQKVATPSTDIGAIINTIRSGAQAPNVDLVETGSLFSKEKRKDLQNEYPSRLNKKLQRLKVGQWIEFGVKSAHKKLCQIAWISQQREKFALVNQQGMRVAEVTSEQMLEKLASGDVILLGDGQASAVDKGLDSLIQKIYEKLSYDTSHDQLTGLLTRKEFEKNLAQSVARAKRNDSRYALLYTDILQFKLVNNLCGYEGGDHLLQHVAGILGQQAVVGQVCGRIGGNEFAIIVPVQSDTEAYRYACQVKAAIESDKFTFGKHSHSVLMAVTLCTFDSHSNQVLELLRTVESAAQIAKTSGLKEVQMVKPGDIRFQERDSMMSWVARITQALENDQLRLRCQKIAPATELHPEWLPHFEVLLTVVDDSGTHVPPAEFIKAAEEYGRMAEVDRWVINQVLNWMHLNKDQLKKFGGFSINLSGHTLNDDSFLDFIFEQLVRYGVPRNKVIFEITETTAVANLDEAADFISEMKEIGCRFSLDDFGAGQSSYAYLKKLPVDFIKIDGAFVKKIDTDKVDFALVKSITEMGHFLNKHIVAEYVSDKAKYDTVVGLGVDYLQGWHISKPVMLDDLIEEELRRPV